MILSSCFIDMDHGPWTYTMNELYTCLPLAFFQELA